VRSVDDEGVCSEGRQTQTHPLAANADVHDLAQRLIVETRVRKSRQKFGGVQSCGPRTNPVFVIFLETTQSSGCGERGANANRENSQE
jgi:hypothetical protein